MGVEAILGTAALISYLQYQESWEALKKIIIPIKMNLTHIT